VRIFVSYSSRQRDLCERLRLALEADGRHEVFVDRAELAPGAPFDETLRHGIASCDLFLFLISPDSVAAGSYARAELSMAQARWRHPAGHVLPVMAAPTPKDDIPPYLRAVTILEPQGDAVAETAAAVEALQRRGRWRRTVPALASGIGLAVLLGVGGVLWEHNRASDAETTLAIAAARELCESGNHALAWQRFDEALARRPDAPRLRVAREDCAMRWLRDVRVVAGQDGFTDVVNRVLPVLADAAISARGQRAADLRAHMGWAEYLRTRDGAASLDPVAHYRKALQAERTNVYAHAMWGHHVMVTRGPIADAVQHLSAALQSGRDRAFVRRLQIAAMLYYHEPPGQAEALRVANEMRAAGETLDPALRERLWTYVYYDAFINRQGLDAVRVALHDAGQPATFRWLYPEEAVRPDRALQWRFILASIEEAAGESRAARTRFQALRDEFQRTGAAGPVVDETAAALQRLTPRP